LDILNQVSQVHVNILKWLEKSGEVEREDKVGMEQDRKVEGREG
jgi:hypothetical protein